MQHAFESTEQLELSYIVGWKVNSKTTLESRYTGLHKVKHTLTI